MESYTADFFQQSETTLAVHVQLRKLLICEYLVINHLRDRFRLNCRTDLPPSMIQEESIEKILDFLERDGKFSEGNYNFIKEKAADVHVEIIMLIQLAEARIKEIRANSLMVKTFVTDVDPIHLEKETREEVDLILLAASEKLLCRSEDDDEDASGLWERYQDLNTLSDEFLNIWHKEFCKCRKQYGRRLLLQYVRKGARLLDLGENKFDRFRRNIVPKLLATLKKSSTTTLHVFKNCGASLVSVVPSSVLSFWIFDSVINLDKLWRKYEEEGVHVNLQEMFNTNDVLSLLNVEKISLNITIEKSDYIKYRQILAEKDPETAYLTATMQKLEISLANRSMEPTAIEKADEITSKPPISSVSLKQRLHEINERFSKTPTVLSFLLQPVDITLREPLYAPVSLIEHNDPCQLYLDYNPKFMRQIENRPSDIFCTSDEYPWVENRSFYVSEEYKISDTNSTNVFMLGESGCGKTTYCFHLLRQWCQGEELQKFDYIFYVDTFVMQTQRISMSRLISSYVFGDDNDFESHVNQVLLNEKCLVLIDGGDYFRDSLHRNNYFLKQLVREYRNSVFVFLMRPVEFANAMSTFPFVLEEINSYVIQLLGLDEKWMSSLYNDIMVKRFRKDNSNPSRDMTMTVSRQRMVESTLHRETNENTDSESDPDSSNRVSDTKAKTTLDLSESEQKLSESVIEDITTETNPEKKMTEHLFEYGSKGMDFYKIKELLEDRLRENYDSVMKVPMLGPFVVAFLTEGEYLPGRNFTSFYLRLVDELVSRYKTSSPDGHQSEKEDKGTEPYRMFFPYENILCHMNALCKLGEVAFVYTFSTAPELLDSINLEKYLEEKEILFAFETSLLVPRQTLSYGVLRRQGFRFLHKSIQDSLLAMYIVSQKENVFDSFCQRLNSVKLIVGLSYVIMMVCGLSPRLGARLSKVIKKIIDEDKAVISHREFPYRSAFIGELYRLQLTWFTEYKIALTDAEGDAEDSFYMSDIYVDDEADKETISKTITVLSEKDIVVTSLYINDVYIETGVSDKLLNNFLEKSTSLVSISIENREPERSMIVPLSFPLLRVLVLQNIDIMEAGNDSEVTKSLLSNLPISQRLELINITLNKRSLGLTSIKGKMPMLKRLHIEGVDLSDQSVELASDMTYIEYIKLYSVRMTSQGWKNFLKSITNIHHSFEVRISKSNIDAESKEMVRTSEKFEVKIDKKNYTFLRKI